jgi:hypothetical protein
LIWSDSPLFSSFCCLLATLSFMLCSCMDDEEDGYLAGMPMEHLFFRKSIDKYITLDSI